MIAPKATGAKMNWKGCSVTAPIGPWHSIARSTNPATLANTFSCKMVGWHQPCSTSRHPASWEAEREQDFRVHPDARFRLYRIGDAVASRDVHAAILDALRLCKDF
jgi:hypothetical protein